MTTTPALQLQVDDTISYKIYVAKAVPLADVNVTAHLELLVSNRDANLDVDSRIRGSLKDFIDTEWTLLEQQRKSATPGYERIELKAMAKIPSSENRNLDERAARAVSNRIAGNLEIVEGVSAVRVELNSGTRQVGEIVPANRHPGHASEEFHTH